MKSNLAAIYNVTPVKLEECQRKLSEQITTHVQRACAAINEELLREGAASYTLVCVPASARLDVFEVLKSLYEDVGWSVFRNQGYDQRDMCEWDYMTVSK